MLILQKENDLNFQLHLQRKQVDLVNFQNKKTIQAYEELVVINSK